MLKIRPIWSPCPKVGAKTKNVSITLRPERPTSQMSDLPESLQGRPGFEVSHETHSRKASAGFLQFLRRHFFKTPEPFETHRGHSPATSAVALWRLQRLLPLQSRIGAPQGEGSQHRSRSQNWIGRSLRFGISVKAYIYVGYASAAKRKRRLCGHCFKKTLRSITKVARIIVQLLNKLDRISKDGLKLVLCH
jgi:hypothetical protein